MADPPGADGDPSRADGGNDRVHQLASSLYDTTGVTFFGAIVFAVLELVFFVVMATPHRLANISPSLMMAHPRDDFAHATAVAFRLHARAGKGGLSVVYLGSSVAQRALYDSWDPRPIERALVRRVRAPVTFYSLYASAETVREAALIGEYVPKGFRGVVTIVVYDDKDDEQNFQAALAQSPWLQERLALDPLVPGEPRLSIHGRPLRKTGIYFLDHLQFFSARRQFLLHPWVAWRPYPRGGYHGRTPPTAFAEERQLIRRFQKPHPLLSGERDLLAKLVEETKASGATTVLVEAPENPRYQEIKGTMTAEYDASIRAFAAEHGVEYWDFNPALKLKRSDFEDALHLGTAYQRFRFQQLYVKNVAAKLAELAGKSKTGVSDDDDDEDDGTDQGAANDRGEPMTTEGERGE